MKIEPTESDLVGGWVTQQHRVVADATEIRIGQLVERDLQKIAVNAADWCVLYGDPSDGRYWELTYPQSEMHGGGPRRLSVIDSDAARTKYGLK